MLITLRFRVFVFVLFCSSTHHASDQGFGLALSLDGERVSVVLRGGFFRQPVEWMFDEGCKFMNSRTNIFKIRVVLSLGFDVCMTNRHNFMIWKKISILL